MDYLFFSGLQVVELAMLVMSYDIACQWHKNLWACMKTYPDRIHIAHDTFFTKFVVPKFHLPAHIEKCQTTFSLNLEVGVGRTDGEAPERSWADHNRAAPSTKEMGPGTRRDHLDDHFGDSNWKKTIKLGEHLLFVSSTVADFIIGVSLFKKMEAAILNESDALARLEDFEESLEEESGFLEEWKEDIKRWEREKTGPNPYDARNPSKCSVHVHKSQMLSMLHSTYCPQGSPGDCQRGAS
jgi:hypothetical protein